ncbi:MAG TPA: hypothetical protein ENK04_00030 [Gammaproteobacteria bacterium]|nr:hypothetical protein [Gammaproteobacteria bacterium]
MKPVVQQEATGCAIASAAALAGVSYASAKKAAKELGITAADPSLWSDTTHIRRLLSHYHIGTDDAETPFTHWKDLPDRALLAIKWHLEKGTPYWHWVVFIRDAHGEYVLDSKKALKQNVRTDFGRIKPKWFIGLT